MVEKENTNMIGEEKEADRNSEERNSEGCECRLRSQDVSDAEGR